MDQVTTKRKALFKRCVLNLGIKSFLGSLIHILENFRTFQENYDNTESQKNTKNDVMLLLYNNRDKVELN